MGSPLWERDGVSEVVADLVAAVRSGRGGVLFVEGDAGLGKSSLLASAVEAATPDLRIGVGRGAAMETSLPFGLLDQALASLGAPTSASGTPSASARSEQLYRLLRWLHSVDRGVVIALDDVHWADGDSLEMLSLLGRRIGAMPVAIIATMRAWPEQARNVAADLVAHGAAHHVRLRPLSREASTAMLAERTRRTISDQTSTKAWELCAGNPLLLEQVALAIDRGSIPTGATDDWPAVRTDGLLLSRFAGLSPTALRCVRAASVLGTRFRPEVAAAVAGLSHSEAEVAVEALCRSSLVEQTEQTEPGVARFVHPLFAQALYDDLPAPLRAQLHARCFEVLVARGLDAAAAEHALRAGLHDDPDVIAVLERAGRAALDVGALETASGQLTTAVELAGERASTSLVLAQAEALLASGDPVAAARTYERVLTRTTLEPDVRAIALRMRGRALYAGGDHRTAATCFGDAADLLLTQDPLAASEALVDQALSMHIVMGPRGCLPMANRAMQLVGQDDDRRVRMRAEAAHGYLTVMAGDASGLSATTAAVRAVRADPGPGLADPAWSWGLTTIHGHAAKYLERFDEAAGAFRSVRLAAEELGAAEALTMSLIGEAEVAARTGRLVEALELSDRASELTDLVPLGSTYNAVVRFFALMHLDRATDADECCRQLEELLDERDEGTARIWLLHLQGIRHLGLGRPDEAAATYLRAERLAEQLGIAEPCVVPWAGRAAIAHARAGREDDAGRVLAQLDASAARLPCRYPAVAAAFGRAELAIRHADHPAAERHYLHALEIHRDAELPMERTSTLLAYGDMLRRTGRPARARGILVEALDLAEATGAPALARYAREGLASSGGRRRRRTPDGHLTPQELRIARMIQSGSSRRDVAARLTVSEATVRTHLERIYRKLDVHSVQELITADLGRFTDA